MGADAWWSVPLAVLLGIPMYSNAAGIIPIVEALLEKGAALGTVLAFMMAVIALSLPETIILQQGAQVAAHRHLPRRRRGRHHARRLPVQRGPRMSTPDFVIISEAISMVPPPAPVAVT